MGGILDFIPARKDDEKAPFLLDANAAEEWLDEQLEFIFQVKNPSKFIFFNERTQSWQSHEE